MKEILILRFELQDFTMTTIHHLCAFGYRRTGQKFDVNFSGSKGYLCSITISCEGIQQACLNRLNFFDLRNKSGSIKKKTVNVFYSKLHGIRLSIGKDEPKTVSIKDKPCQKNVDENVDDLPF